jgi:ParB family chromosome partitioning protein
MLPDALAMEHLATRIVAEGLSVRAAEEIVSIGEHGTKRAPRSKRPVEASPAAERLQQELVEKLDTRVLISQGRSRGRIVIEFAGDEDLERLAALLT